MGGGGAPNQLQSEILVIPPPVSSGLAFEFQQLGTEIQEQSNLNPRRSQIIHTSCKNPVILSSAPPSVCLVGRTNGGL